MGTGLRCALVVGLLTCACNRSRPAAGTAPAADAGGPAIDLLVSAKDLGALGLKVDTSRGSFHVDHPESGRVEVNYEYSVEGVSVANSLNIETDLLEAQRFYDQMLSGQQRILERDGLKMAPCSAEAEWDAGAATVADQRDCVEVLNDAGPAGFFTQLRRDRRIVLLMVFAPRITELEPKLLALARNRLDALLAYQP